MAASIFRDDRDRLRFLETLEENCEKTGWLVHAYGLMSDHYHPLMETPEANGDRMGRRRYEAYVESRALEVERRGRVAEDLEAEEELPRALEVLGWEEAAVLFGAQTGVGLVAAQADGGVVGREWIAERLRMGHATRVTWAVGRVRRAAGGEVARWRNRLEKQVDR